MQLRFLTLVFFFFLFSLCTQALPSFAPKRLLVLQHEGFNISKAIIQEQEAQSKNGTLGLQRGGDEKGRQVIFTTRKSKGKSGAYGGANIVRKPHPRNSALTLPARGCYPILSLSFGLILASLFWL